MVEAEGACTLTLSTTCGIPNMFSCPISLANGMSGGPVIDTGSGYVIASNDITCSEYTCWGGYTPYTDYYNIFNLLAVFGQ